MSNSLVSSNENTWVTIALNEYAKLRGTTIHELDHFSSLIHSGNEHEALGEIVEVMVDEGLAFDTNTLHFLDSAVPIYPDNDWDADIRDAIDFMLERKTLNEIFQG